MAAQALYRSFGFRDAGRRIAYYSDNGEDAMVMTTPDFGDLLLSATIAVERARTTQGETP